MLCMNKHQKKNGSTRLNSSGGSASSLGLNNSRSEADRNKLSLSGAASTPTGPFQYESFHVFDWDAYLEVSLYKY